MAFDQATASALVELSSDVDVQIRQLQDLVSATNDATAAEAAEATRLSVIGKLHSMTRLLYEPVEYLKNITQGNALDLGTLRTIIQYRIAEKVPDAGEVSITELATRLSVAPGMLSRILAYSSTYGIFRTSNDRVAHTPASLALAHGRYAEVAEWDINIPQLSAFRLYEALEQFKDCDGPDRAPFKLGLNTASNFYEFHQQEPKWGEYFRKGMESEQADKRVAPQNCIRAYDWATLKGKTVVDLGGSTGHVSQMILDEHPGINFIVQDHPETISALSPELKKGPLTFQAHDFFQDQPTVADAYFLRYIFHNWGDADCRRILLALRPALRPGARLLVAEVIGPQQAEQQDIWFEERLFRRRDLQMLTFLGAHERTVSEYDSMVREAIPELKFAGCKRPIGSSLGVMEWVC